LGLGLPIVHQPATASGGAVEPRAADGGLDATISLLVATDQPHATGA
jgi:C4-dicarboxylate-specific signal transduction histidine kinase